MTGQNRKDGDVRDRGVACGKGAAAGVSGDLSARDAALGAVIDRAAADCRAGLPVNVEALAATHPELASELRELLPAVLAMEATAGETTGPAEAPRDVLESDRRLGDFRLIREVGRGGMGVVYEAEQVSLRRKVALKILPVAAALDGRALQRFRNEAIAAAGLHHPNVVPVHGVGVERGVHYLAMQFVDGPPLSELVRRARAEAGLDAGDRPVGSTRQAVAGGPPGSASDPFAATVVPDAVPGHVPHPVSPSAETAPAAAASTELAGRGASRHRSAARLVRQAAEALEYAHSLGVVHRDVKPSNLLLDSRGNLWVADFGLAQLETDAGLTMSGDLLGTLRYMSPEQATGRRGLVDHRSDVYGLGLTLYELLTLRPAFPQTHRAELIRAVVAEDPARPRSLDASVPRDLETVVLKATAKDPRKRYQTAKQLAEDVGRFLAGEPVLARRASLPDRGLKWAKRHRATATGIVTTVLALLGFATAFGYREASASRRANQAAREDLSAARAAFESGGFDVAGKELAEAEGRNPAAAILEETGRLRDALEKYRRFRKAAESALDNGESLPRAQAALAVYDVLDRDDWREAVARGALPEPQRRDAEATVYKLLVTAADNLLPSGADPAFVRPADARETLRYLRKAAELGPTSVLYHLREQAHRALGDEAAAARDRAVAAAAKPSIALDHYVPGHDLAWKGRNREAVARYRAALRLEPRHYPSMFFLANHENPDNPDAKLAGWLGCAAVRPDHATVRVNLALIYRELGHDRDAAEEYALALPMTRDWVARFPDDWGPWWVLRLLHGEFEEWDEVGEVYEQELVARPDDFDLRFAAAEFFLTGAPRGKRRPDRAAEIAREAERMAPAAIEAGLHGSTAYHDVMLFYAARGDLEGARRARAALLAHHSSPIGDLWASLAHTHWERPGEAEAAVALERAERAAAAFGAPWDVSALGMAYLRAGRTEDAAAAFRRSLRLGGRLGAGEPAEPGAREWHGNVVSRLGLALAELDLGRRTEARRLLAGAVPELDDPVWDVRLTYRDRPQALILRREVEARLAPAEAPRR